jgi:hypothetical protein
MVDLVDILYFVIGILYSAAVVIGGSFAFVRYAAPWLVDEQERREDRFRKGLRYMTLRGLRDRELEE